MECQSFWGPQFLGPMTAMTAAGVQPIGSVFSAVPAAAALLGRDTMPQFPPSRARSAPARHLENRDLTPGLCGCTA